MESCQKIQDTLSTPVEDAQNMELKLCSLIARILTVPKK